MDEGLTERPSESKRLVLTSLPHQLQPAAWPGRNPHHCLFKATMHKLGVSEVIQGRKRKASALPVGVAPVGWWFRVPCGGRCHREFHSKHQTCHSPEPHGPAQQEGRGRDEQYSPGCAIFHSMSHHAIPWKQCFHIMLFYICIHFCITNPYYV